MKLAIPSKGRLKKEVLSWFNHKGVKILTSEDNRSYSASVIGFSDIQLFFLPPIEIPMLLSKGSIDIGVTGQDLVEEKIPNWDKYLIELIELGIGHANLVIAVPEFWVDVNNLEDLDDVSKIFREKMGFRLRIATKYQNLARKYLKDFGLADYILIDSQGATEGLIENEAAEVVIDISSTGQTFKSNNLKVLQIDPIIKSQVAIFSSLKCKKEILLSEKNRLFFEKLSINLKDFYS